MKPLVVAKGDYWVGVYANGKLVYEDHELPNDRLIKLMIRHFIAPQGVDFKSVDLDWLDNHGNLPDVIEEVVWE